MSIFSGRSGLALILLAALCPTGRTAHAQGTPLSYWIPGWPLGFAGTVSESSSTYGNFPSFGDSRGGGFGYTRFNFPNGWFVGNERAGIGLSMSSIGQDAFGNFGSLYTEGVQFGYSFKNEGGLPITLYAGFDTLKYDTGVGSPLAPFDSASGTLPGYGAHAGIEFQPASNVSLSLGFGYAQQSGRIDSDINSSLLPGASPLAFGAYR